MQKKLLKNYKFIVTVIVVGIFAWFLIISPMISFHENETKLTEAAKRYFELNSDKLPIGERVKTLSLSVLYDEAYLKEALRTPYSGKVCSLENSWVKVTQKNGEYKYYTYLDCGILKSSVDHKGPKIKLNGDEEITINLGSKYKDAGIKSVTDNTDGKMKIKDVTVKSDVDTNNVGTYEVNYIAHDSLNNKTVVTRYVTVVRKLNETVKKELKNETYYKGNDPNNYIYFSNVLFRILSIDGNNIKIVAESDVSNVNYDSIDKWFKYYDEHLTDTSKKLIVKNKYCDMDVSDNKLNVKKCSSYGKKKMYSLLSIDDINNTLVDGESYLVGNTISWTNNTSSKKNAYAFRNLFYNSDSIYYPFEKSHNYGVRPVITIDGNTLITDGDGSYEKPYVLTDYIKSKRNEILNQRYSGEYFVYSDYLWRIQEVESDGTTRAICNQSLFDGLNILKISYDNSVKDTQYDPTVKGNVGYKINNIASKYIDTSYFVNHEIEVPIYEGEPEYNKEKDIKKYTVKISSPNMYDMYSAESISPFAKSYWLLNSSKSKNEFPGVSETGSVLYGEGSMSYSYGIRPVVYFNKNISISSGKGTIDEPFIIKK